MPGPNYPDEPGYQDTDTSYEAAQLVDAEKLRGMVYRYHKARAQQGLTDAELDAMKPPGCPTLRPRRCELTRAGTLRDTGARRLSPTGRKMIVWSVR